MHHEVWKYYHSTTEAYAELLQNLMVLWLWKQQSAILVCNLKLALLHVGE